MPRNAPASRSLRKNNRSPHKNIKCGQQTPSEKSLGQRKCCQIWQFRYIWGGGTPGTTHWFAAVGELTTMKSIRVGVIGVGNCASSLVQGLAYCHAQNNKPIGLPFPVLGGYAPADIEVSCAFDVDGRKVGRDLAEAIFAPPNCTTRFWPNVPRSGVTVSRGLTLDGVSATTSLPSSSRTFEVSDEPEPNEDDVVRIMRDSDTEMVVNFLPVGSQQASEFYANCALRAGVALVNAIPVFLASDQSWQRRFKEAGLPILGDDFKAQMGATVIQRNLTRLFDLRGAKLDRSYQLNVGGNTDFLNMTDADRLVSKRRSKTEAVQTALKDRLHDEDIRIGPSDYVPWLNDQKVAYMRMEGRLFGGVPMNIEVRISVEDSPNAAAMALIAVRCARIALDRGLSGAIDEVNGFLFKSPSQPMLDEDGHASLLRFAESA